MLNAYEQLPEVIGHRGACGNAPENTLASVREAHNQGALWIETDVMLSSDHVPVIFHDEDLDRTSNGLGPLLLRSSEQLSVLDAGSWMSDAFTGERIPTLEDMIHQAKSLNIGLNLEIKPYEGHEKPTVEKTVETLRNHWPDHLPLLLSSFSFLALKHLKRLWPEVTTGYNVSIIPDDWQDRLDELGCNGIHFYAPFFNENRVSEIRKAGYHVLAFTVNDPREARTLLDAGVSAVFTDYPGQLIPALAI